MHGRAVAAIASFILNIYKLFWVFSERKAGNSFNRIVEINLLILILQIFWILINSINSIFGTSFQVLNTSLIGISFIHLKPYLILMFIKGVVFRSHRLLLLYVSLFHQLMAGPITRYKDIGCV